MTLSNSTLFCCYRHYPCLECFYYLKLNFLKKKKNLFIYLWLSWIFIALLGFLQLQWAGATFCCGAGASRCSGFSCCRARALRHAGPSSCSKQRLLSSCRAQASRCSGFSCCRARALGHMGFRSCGTWTRLLRLPGSGAQSQSLVTPQQCGILLDRGLNSRLLHWQADASFVLSHQGSPRLNYF